MVTKAVLPEQIAVVAGTWQRNPESVVQSILTRFAGKKLAIRSSAVTEDTEAYSMAGAHLSLINVEAVSSTVKNAIDDVLDSYLTRDESDEVLVQPMVERTAVAGVVLTRDLSTGAPYYVINYDDFSGRTDTVTGGAESKAILVHRAQPGALRSPRFRKLIDAVIEIELATGTGELDIEFCIDSDDEVFILQVRPVAASRHWAERIDHQIDTALGGVQRKINSAMGAIAGVAGDNGTIFGEMPDWNPAEMIGNTPRPLALSLYRNLITDRVWSKARADLGYRDVNHPLMIDLAGRPFVDVRLSLNSFLPAKLEEPLAARLVEQQLCYLGENRDYHDKIEFEVAITARDFVFEDRCHQLRESGFSAHEIDQFEVEITGITQRLLNWVDGQMDAELSITAELAAQVDDWPRDWSSGTAADLLDATRTFGTLPFSKLARHGFIAILMLDSLVRRGVLSRAETEQFMRGIPTVATEFLHDLGAANTGQISTGELISRYGHLRPGAYDILSERYDQRPDLYFAARNELSRRENTDAWSPSAKQMNEIDRLLAEVGFDYDAPRLLVYISSAVRAREKAKFNFMRAVSRLLELVAEWGAQHDLTRDDMSFVPIERLATLDGPEDIASYVSSGREAHLVTQAIRLPHLVMVVSDINVIRLPLGQPNFITSKSVTAPVHIQEGASGAYIDGKILLIESADPGFDWIFAHNIAGLITKFGGANSHMAIRSAEFGLPAAIGCGDRLFEILSDAQVVELNCAARTVKAASEQR